MHRYGACWAGPSSKPTFWIVHRHLHLLRAARHTRVQHEHKRATKQINLLSIKRFCRAHPRQLTVPPAALDSRSKWRIVRQRKSQSPWATASETTLPCSQPGDSSARAFCRLADGNDAGAALDGQRDEPSRAGQDGQHADGEQGPIRLFGGAYFTACSSSPFEPFQACSAQPASVIAGARLRKAPALVAHFRTVHSGEVGGLVLHFRVVEILSEKIVVGRAKACGGEETPLERVWRLRRRNAPKAEFPTDAFVSNRAFARSATRTRCTRPRPRILALAVVKVRKLVAELVTFHGSRNAATDLECLLILQL